VEYCPVTYGAVSTHLGLFVEDAMLLNVSAFSHGNSAAVTAQNSAIPNIYILAQFHLAGNNRPRRNIYHKNLSFFVPPQSLLLEEKVAAPRGQTDEVENTSLSV